MFAPSSRAPLVRAIALAALAASAFILAQLSTESPRRAIAAAPASHEAGAPMSDDAMRAMFREHFTAHPPPHAARATAAPVDSFIAVNFRFEEDGNATTQVDTAHIEKGESIRFKYGIGIHTVVSGTGSTDPQSGAMFNMPMMSSTDTFDFPFDTVGTFPFYCSIHEGLNMRGVVDVVEPTSVTPIVALAGRSGFISPPSPNPTSGGASFRFALPRPGRARLDAFDVQGRRIATLVDRHLPAGLYAATWDGRDAAGARVQAGVYALRVSVPGRTETRRVVVER